MEITGSDAVGAPDALDVPVCAVSLHVSGAAIALLTLRGDIEDNSSGAPAIELSLEPVAVRETKPTDLPLYARLGFQKLCGNPERMLISFETIRRAGGCCGSVLASMTLESAPPLP